MASSILRTEILNNPDPQRRSDALDMFRFADEFRSLDHRVANRGKTLAVIGYGSLDALHLAVAESSNIDWLLTTDDRFLRQMSRGLGNPTVKAANPVEWLMKAAP